MMLCERSVQVLFCEYEELSARSFVRDTMLHAINLMIGLFPRIRTWMCQNVSENMNRPEMRTCDLLVSKKGVGICLNVSEDVSVSKLRMCKIPCFENGNRQFIVFPKWWIHCLNGGLTQWYAQYFDQNAQVRKDFTSHRSFVHFCLDARPEISCFPCDLNTSGEKTFRTSECNSHGCGFESVNFEEREDRFWSFLGKAASSKKTSRVTRRLPFTRLHAILVVAGSNLCVMHTVQINALCAIFHILNCKVVASNPRIFREMPTCVLYAMVWVQCCDCYSE